MADVTRRLARGAVAAAAALLLGAAAAACGAQAEPDRKAAGSGDPAAPSTSPRAGDGTRTEVRKAGSVGAETSACPLPVVFDLAEGWSPEAVAHEPDGEFAALLEQGPVSLRCEIDAKPAGHIGFLRVWAGGAAGDDPRAALEAFVADAAADREDEVYTETKAGAYDAVEVRYLNTGELLDAPKRERAFALTTPDGVVVVDLGGLDSEEHEQMLPAYELARKSLRDS
ncbi:lipoprotein [Streptomyces zhihengii]|uniref:DUF3558 domain-containing protein n=1 Tax=Streptomyces zhihengii TaxID=1818004 RepID=A0ABS2URM4_9ACTN|nr:lipoprotein [Streptomyces zhihengii]MBM9620206.1 hypothetical protein [Streptomyces zhihengii]